MISRELLEKELALMPKLPDGNTRVSAGFLNKHARDVVFVFGDNVVGKGFGGQAAVARKVSNSFGFVTKKNPTHSPRDYFKPDEYQSVFDREIRRLKAEIEENPDKWYLVPTLGNGLANKYNIWEKIIRDRIKPELGVYPNVLFLY